MDNPDYIKPALGPAKPQRTIPELPPLPDSKDIRDFARLAEPEICKTYWELMTDDEVPATVRKACADALADRARGKPAGEAPQIAVQINGVVPDEEVIRKLQFLFFAGGIDAEKMLPPVEAEVVNGQSG